jgi:hypothetical protein
VLPNRLAPYHYLPEQYRSGKSASVREVSAWLFARGWMAGHWAPWTSHADAGSGGGGGTVAPIGGAACRGQNRLRCGSTTVVYGNRCQVPTVCVPDVYIVARLHFRWVDRCHSVAAWRERSDAHEAALRRRLKCARGSWLLRRCPPTEHHKDNPMRATKIGRPLTGVEALYASEVTLAATGLVFAVRPRWRKARCGARTKLPWPNPPAVPRFKRGMAKYPFSRPLQPPPAAACGRSPTHGHCRRPRRVYGFHNADALMAMLYLCAGEVELNPALPK